MSTNNPSTDPFVYITTPRGILYEHGSFLTLWMVSAKNGAAMPTLLYPLRDFWLPPPSMWEVRSSGSLRSEYLTSAALILTIWRQYQLITHKPRAFYKVQFGTQPRGPRIGENREQRGTGPSPALQIVNASRLTRTDRDGIHLSASTQHSYLIQQLHQRLTCWNCMKRHTNSASPVLSFRQLGEPGFTHITTCQ